MNEEDLQLILVRYGSDTGLISLAAQAILCHTVETADGGLEWPKGVPIVDFSEESRFTKLLGQDPDEPQHNWEDVLQYVLEHQRELGLGEYFLAQLTTASMVVTRTLFFIEVSIPIQTHLLSIDKDIRIKECL